MNKDRYSHTSLSETTERLLTTAGMRREQAATVGTILVEADLMGHSTHGLNLLPGYLAEIETGRMNVADDYTVLADSATTVVWDGAYISGVYLTQLAIEAALKRSERSPVVTWSIRRAHHIGCLAAYMPQIVERGRIGILLASDPAARMVAPFGGKTPVYSPNPIAAGIPAGPDGPIIVDISTSVTAGGVVNRHREAGTPLPGAWLLDGDGNVTDDATAMADGREGSIMPLGGLDAGYKGYALGLIVEALTSGLGGYGRRDQPTNWGTSVYLQIIDPEGFGGRSALEGEMAWLADACRGAEPREGYDTVRIPGDRALARRREQMERGVDLPAPIKERLAAACLAAEIPMPATLHGTEETRRDI